MRLVDHDLYQQLKTSGQLPSPRGVAFAIIRLLQRDDYKLDELVQLVQSDPAIAGRLLKFANAAAFGAGRPIVSLSKAVTVLGAFRVRDLVLGFSVLHSHREGECAHFDYPRFWSRALACAIAAQALAAHAQIAAEENFTAGLLCSIGELALASLFPRQYDVIAATDALHGRLLLEREKFGTDHRELAATLLLEWGLPEPIATAAYYCEMPDEADFADGSRNQRLTLSLHIARCMAEICVAEDAERWNMVPELFSRAARLGIGTEELTRMADAMTSNWREWGKTLEIRTHDIPPFADLLSSSPPREAENAGATPNQPRNSLALLVGMTDADTAEIGSLLKSDGYRVLATPSSRDGLVVALRESPQLILLALGTDSRDADAYCRALRDSPLGRDVYLIVIGRADQETLLTPVLDAGADDFMLQPVTAPTLHARLKTVEKVIHLHQAIRRERNDLVRSAGEWAGTQRRLIQVAMTDPLTHLPNRRHGMDFLSAEWVFATSNNLPLACLMLDIDHFKRVNDQHGHKAGDAILAALARMLQISARSEDMVFRYGGEEFCMVCPGADLKTAGLIAERIRQSVETENFMFEELQIAVTVSLGVSALSPSASSAETLIRQADGALYQAKEGGRNRVAFFSPASGN